MLNDAAVMITGGTGSLGATLVAAINFRYKPKRIVVYSRDEYKQHKMQQQLGQVAPCLRFFLGDVRDSERLTEVMAGCDYVIHTAAYKQIDRIEYNPLEAVKTNVQGASNVVRACLATGVKRAVFISTDKAVAPVNLYGATKLCGEKLFLAANAFNKTEFKVVRYGNVLASRGSVIETFLALKSQGIRQFPITDEAMTRFWIQLPQAADLVLDVLRSDVKVGIPHIPSMKITDVARAIDPDCTFTIVGIRPGEKLHECLVSPDERVPGFENGYFSHMNDLWLTRDDLRKQVGL